MKRLKEYNTYDFEVPKQIMDDLSPDEEILFKLKTVGLLKFKWILNYMVFGFIIFIIITTISTIIRTNGKAINSGIFWASSFVLFPSIILFMIFAIDLADSITESFIIITNKRIIPYETLDPSEFIEFYDSFDIVSVNFLTYKIRKSKKQTVSKG
ncbi:MAG: hypothetical protein ACFFDK_19065, partial [Promethearchaeota archaeon]